MSTDTLLAAAVQALQEWKNEFVDSTQLVCFKSSQLSLHGLHTGKAPSQCVLHLT